MKTVGRRQPPAIATAPSGALLAEGARAMESMRDLAGANAGFIPKGVYRFRTLAEADQHRDQCQAAALAARHRNRA